MTSRTRLEYESCTSCEKASLPLQPSSLEMAHWKLLKEPGYGQPAPTYSSESNVVRGEHVCTVSTPTAVLLAAPRPRLMARNICGPVPSMLNFMGASGSGGNSSDGSYMRQLPYG